MPRKQQSEFHKRIQGSAFDTLKVKETRCVIDNAVSGFKRNHPSMDTVEALCSIRDHVNALIGAKMDLDEAKHASVRARIDSGEFKGNPQGALDALKSIDDSLSMSDLHAEVDRQGIPD